MYPDLVFTKMVVSSAGASAYAASEVAAAECPDLDQSLRGALSIARRLQNPLKELTKIDPKALVGGSYCHDMNPAIVNEALQAVMKDCANKVKSVIKAPPAKTIFNSAMADALARLKRSAE